MTDVQVEKREWLILEPGGRCYWREGRQGYSDVVGAGLYSTREADGIVAMGRGDKKVHVDSPEVQAALRHAQEGVKYHAHAALNLEGEHPLKAGARRYMLIMGMGADAYVLDHMAMFAGPLYHALTMVRDADEDCRKDGLATIPATARACIDEALRFAAGEEEKR